MPISVLVVRCGSLGDVVLTTPLLRAVHRAHPDARITYVTKRAYAPLLESHPHVTTVVALEPGERVTSLARRLQGTRWDHRLDLHGSLRSVALRALLGGRWGTWARRRGRRALLILLGVDTLSPPVPVAERYFEAARRLGVAPDGAPAEIDTTPDDDARAAALVGGRPYVALCPGAAHWNKRWPPPHWRALARTLAARGHAIVGIGTAAEREFLDDPDVISGFGVGLGPAAALLRGARAAVANDSGLLHLATAVGTPVVALFGPTSPAFGYAPYRNPGVVLERDLPCRPCSAFGGPHCPMRHHRCMIDLDPAGVAAALESLT
jgi:heptosyltransferase-2